MPGVWLPGPDLTATSSRLSSELTKVRGQGQPEKVSLGHIVQFIRVRPVFYLKWNLVYYDGMEIMQFNCIFIV